MFKILIIEDHSEIMAMTTELIGLHYDDAEIITANSGHQAIELLKTNSDFDFIISDYMMPNGNGVEVLRYTQANKYPAYFILYTSHIAPEIPTITSDRFLGVVPKFEFDQISLKIDLLISKAEMNKNKKAI